MAVSVCEAQRPAGKPDKALFGKSLKTKRVKVREPRSIGRARREQEAKKRKSDKEYEEYVKESRKRAVRIQSPEVQDRMTQNRKNTDRQYKLKKKKREEKFRKADKKS